MTGHLFGDRYQVGDTLGFGGMSEVHRGRDLRLGRDVAIKVLRADLARDPSFQARFRREAQNAASLNHPAIVAVYDTGETQGEAGPVPYIVMEYVDGETLRDLLKREGSLQPKRAMEIVADVCAALDFSHRHGIVHRDIKPANVMLTRAGAVKVMDFGIARAVADGQATMTATAAVIGTAQYLSPEQARGEAVDARSDVYATGCVLFELLTGAPPFTGDSPVAVAYQHVREDAKAPSEVKPGLPRELDAIVLKALNKNPLNRYQTAAEMRSDLVRALSGQAVHATPIMPAEERTELMRPGPMRVGGVQQSPAPLLAPPRRPLTDESWDDDPAPDRSKRVWGFVGIGVLCLALLGGAIFLTLKLTQGPARPLAVKAPSVANMTLADASKALDSSGLKVGQVTYDESPDSQKDKVFWQNPSVGSQVDQGTPVDLKIGLGISEVTVPNVGRLSADEAKRQITANKLKYDQKLVESPDRDKGFVIDQTPKVGEKVKPGSTVTVQVGKGLTYVQVPVDLKGKSYVDAENLLKKVGLKAAKSIRPGIEALDTVVDASEAPGKQLAQGQTVILTVSDNQLFKMISIQYDSPEQAAEKLKALGWKGAVDRFNKTTQPVTDRGLVDRIVDQTPKTDAVLQKSGEVAIVIGTPKKVAMPDLRDLTRDQIQQKMSEAGFVNFGFVSPAPAPPNPALANKWISSSVPPSTEVDWDTRVNIAVYGAPVVPSTTPTPTPGQPGVPPTGNRPGGGIITTR